MVLLWYLLLLAFSFSSTLLFYKPMLGNGFILGSLLKINEHVFVAGLLQSICNL